MNHYLLRSAALPAVMLGGWLFIAVSCARPPAVTLESPADTTTIATAANGYRLTAGELYQAITTSAFLPGGGLLPIDSMVAIRDSLILDSLIDMLAAETRIEDSYAIHRVYRKNRQERLIAEYWDQTIRRNLTADSMEVLQLYRDSIHLFEITERMLLRHILISPLGLLIGPDSAYYRERPGSVRDEDAAELARNIHMMLRFGESFYLIARRLSHDDQFREEGGLVGWVGKGVYLPPFDSIAFRLKPFEFSSPYKDNTGWHIIKSEGYLPDGPAPVDTPAVYESAYQSLLNVKYNIRSAAIMDSLIQAMQIRHNDAVLDTTIYYVADTVWFGIVNGTDTIDAKDIKEVEENYRTAYKVANTTPELKKEMMRELALPILQVQAARAAGVDTLPHFRMESERARLVSARQIVEAMKFDADYEPDSIEIARYYHAHRDEFMPDKPITVQLLSTRDSAFCQFLNDQANTGLSFDDIISEFSTSESPITTRLLSGVDAGSLSPEQLLAVQSTPRGKISRSYRAGSTWQFLKLIELREPKSELEARGLIVIRLMAERRASDFRRFRDSLFARYQVKFPVRLSGDLPLEGRNKRIHQPKQT